MTPHLGWGLFVFLVIVGAFFGIHYTFLQQQGFDAANYLMFLL
jgi:hypothetical protein